MAEPFKNEYNSEMIAQMGGHLHRVWPEFNTEGFARDASAGLSELELKERLMHIADVLTTYLPNDFEKAVLVMKGALAPYNEDWSAGKELGVIGWGSLVFNRYVSQNGLRHFDASMDFFKEATSRFSAEFDIRYFLLDDPKGTLKQLSLWTKNANYHVRRLVSEGTRPRLPWAMKLQPFIDDPSPILPLLEALKDDDEEYVRRSVANNLNDIAKDHPDLVAEIASKWLQGAGKNRKRLVQHACRTLVKQGHQPTLRALGYGEPDVTLEALNLLSPKVMFGEGVVFDVVLRSTSKKPQNIMIDYAIHHRKANGSTSPKVFKWKNCTLRGGDTLKASKKHAIKPITTRVYYNGGHAVEIFVNGMSLGLQKFELEGV